MSHVPTGTPTGQQGWPPPSGYPTPPPRRSLLRRLGRLGLFATAGFVGLVVLVTVIAVVAESGGGEQPQPGSTVSRMPASPAPVEEQTTTANDPPRPGDFRLGVKVLKKECFGEAGCNITYRIAPAYRGPAIDAGTSYSVTYEIRGGESPQINTFTITGDQYEVDSEEFISTISAGAKLTARVTEVSPG